MGNEIDKPSTARDHFSLSSEQAHVPDSHCISKFPQGHLAYIALSEAYDQT